MSWRVLSMLVPMAWRENANLLAAAFDPDVGGERTFDFVRMSGTGIEPASHAGAQTLIRPSLLQQVEFIKASGVVPAALRGSLSEVDANSTLAQMQFHVDEELHLLAARFNLQLITAEVLE